MLTANWRCRIDNGNVMISGVDLLCPLYHSWVGWSRLGCPNTPSPPNVLCHGMPTKHPPTMWWKGGELPYKERICPSVSFFFSSKLTARGFILRQIIEMDTMSDDKHDEQDEREKQEEQDKFLRKLRKELPRGEDDFKVIAPML